ncbi:MAG: hypothetical protein H6712_17260 [Myxococcales bacterium]|nr:hypothetical protein [Myxococcales bacterium]MCB9715621.1 hypothetical protein [Myxococcales bacterium]
MSSWLEPSAPRPEPPPAPAVVPVERPFRAKAVLVPLPVESGSAVLFTDERARVRRHAARSLAARGLAVASIDQLERIERGAAEGRLVLEDDRRCRAALTPRELRARYLEGMPAVWLVAECWDHCELQASIGEGVPKAQQGTYTSGPIPRPHDPRSWEKVRLRRAHSVMGGVVGDIIGSSHPPPIVLGYPVSIGPWGSSPPDGSRLAQVGLVGCAHPDPLPQIVYEMRLAVATDGSIERCEVTTEHVRARAAEAECLCQGVRELRYEPGAEGRRLRVTATDNGVGGFTRFELAPVQPGTEPWIERLREAGVLPTCVAEGEPAEDFEATVVLGLHPDGEVHDVRVYGEIDTAEEIRFSQCLVRELPLVPLPCAPPGVDALHVGIVPRP